jgi:hypothetical protein
MTTLLTTAASGRTVINARCCPRWPTPLTLSNRNPVRVCLVRRPFRDVLGIAYDAPGQQKTSGKMGNSSSSGRSHQDETVDFGYLTPQGVYTGPRDWNQSIVTQFIVDRKLAPFYRPLEDYDESWDDDQILAHMKEPQPQENIDSDQSGTRADAASIVSSSSRTHNKRPSASSREVIKDQPRHPELGIYRGATECPICFLVRPDCGLIASLSYTMLPVLPLKHKSFSLL